MDFPVLFPDLRNQAVMVSMTYEEAVASAELFASMIEALPQIVARDPDQVARYAAAESIYQRMRSKLECCCVALEAMHKANQGD